MRESEVDAEYLLLLKKRRELQLRREILEEEEKLEKMSADKKEKEELEKLKAQFVELCLISEKLKKEEEMKANFEAWLQGV